MKKQINLLEGPIFPALTKLALPIMATSLIQMAYNLIDMLWIGRMGSDAVAAVGAAGMYLWLASGLSMLARMGGQVKVGHAIGAKQQEESISYTKASIQLALLFGMGFGLMSLLLATPLIGFFKLNSPQVVADANIYLQITGGAIVFQFLNQIFTGIMTAMGDSKTPFVATTAGLVVNIVLDPVLIFGMGLFPAMGAMGAAIATALAQVIVTVLFLRVLLKDETIFRRVKVFSRLEKQSMIPILKIGFPSAMQSMIFTCISMVIARMVAGFGDAAVAVQKVGSQIESISWTTAEGFSAAVNSFVAQNYGAKNVKRIKKGYTMSMTVVFVWGLLCTALLMLAPGPVFQLFIPDKGILSMGISYLWILGISQLFMCIEMTTAGAFSGFGKTMPPSVVGIVFTAARIPAAMILSSTSLGLDGIWWSISISSVLKGVVLLACFMYYLRNKDSKREGDSDEENYRK